jgi:hypothetical protein
MTELKSQSPFSKSLPTLQLAWDSTSIGWLKTCPRKYQYKMLENWTKRGMAIPLEFGILYHSALEAYDKGKATGLSHDEATEACVLAALIKGKDFIGDSKRNKETLIRAVVWYLEAFKDDPAKTIILANGQPAVELSFRMEISLPNPDGEPYILCGHLDRLVEMGDSVYVVDHKTTSGTISSHYYNQYSPNNQMSLYTLGSRVVLSKPATGVIINACQLAVGFARFHRGIVTRTQAQTEEWMKDLECWIKKAETFARENYWPMNDTACMLYGGCEFQGVCSNDPSMRKTLLQSDFEKKTWNPLEVR